MFLVGTEFLQVSAPVTLMREVSKVYSGRCTFMFKSQNEVFLNGHLGPICLPPFQNEVTTCQLLYRTSLFCFFSLVSQ